MLGLVSVVLFVLNLREQALDRATQRAGDAARLVEEHAIRVFRSTDFVLGLAGEIAAALSRHPDAARSQWQALRHLREGMTEPGDLWIIDPEGVIRLGTVAFPMPPVAVADRDYFKGALSTGDGPYVGPLIKVRNREAYAFHVSRRIDGPDGKPLAVVAAGLDAASFTNFYDTLPLGRAGAVGIVAMDGRVILRQPQPERYVGRSFAGSPVLAQAATAPVGTLVAVSGLDGVERIFAFRRVPGLDVFVFCSISVEDALAGWYRALWLTVSATAVVGALLTGLFLVAFRSLGREEAVIHGLEDLVADRTEEARRQAAEARRANESKSRYLAAASHDLRQPLQAAGMFVEALAGRIEDARTRVILDRLRQSIDAGNALMTTILDASALEAGKVRPSVRSFPLAPMLAGLADQYEADAEARGLRLKVVATDAWVDSDPVLLERILRNLLVNALRFTPRGGVLIGCRRRGSDVAIQVVDSGIGVPADMHEAIFEDFTRIDVKAGTRDGRGLGLGLAVVGRTAELLGHRVGIASVPGKGSVFTVVVPRSAA